MKKKEINEKGDKKLNHNCAEVPFSRNSSQGRLANSVSLRLRVRACAQWPVGLLPGQSDVISRASGLLSTALQNCYVVVPVQNRVHHAESLAKTQSHIKTSRQTFYDVTVM